jgi:nucleoside-diphosphate-sugar epimerase/predicted dehydrogenase
MRLMTRNVAILGAGYISDWHCRALRAVRGVRVAAVCDLHADRARALATRYGIPAHFTELGALLWAAKPDAVHVLLPADRHIAAVDTLLAAGVPALVEKPLCPTAEECRALALRARQAGVPVGVGHNYLFDESYERLRADVRTGRLGRLDQVTITWNRSLPRLRTGPFGAWLLRHPAHIMLEIGPHSAGQLLDLVGPPDRLTAEADRPVELPTGVVVPRRWLARAHCGPTVVDLKWSFEDGFGEHRIDVRGTAGSATADLERGTYVLRRPGASGLDDLERYRQTVAEGEDLVARADAVFGRYVLTKLGLSAHGNPFCTSIARALRSFYAGLGGTADERLSADFAARVMDMCAQIVAAAGLPPLARPSPSPPAPLPQSRERGEGRPTLVLGGTGFIGQVVVRKLVEAGRPVRLLVREPAGLPRSLRDLPLDVVRGDLTAPADLAAAFAGVRAVVHLARGGGTTWEEYVRTDLEPTCHVAAACLKHGVRRLVYTGTIDALNTAGRRAVITDDTPLDPRIRRRNLYARAKAEGERWLLRAHAERDLPVVIARPGIVVGVGGSPFHWGVGHWPAPFVCRLWGRGDTPLPLVMLDDVARALVRMLDVDGIDGQTFNLVAETDLTARDYVEALGRALGTAIDVRPKPAWRSYAEDLAKYLVKVLARHPGRRLPSYRDWETRAHRARFDCAKAKRVLGWQPVTDRATLLREGVEEPGRAWLGVTMTNAE